MWDVTVSDNTLVFGDAISTHTSRVGCDAKTRKTVSRCIYFYSHIPCVMWQGVWRCMGVRQCISTHTSRVGCDGAKSLKAAKTFRISTHTSRVGCDKVSGDARVSDNAFLLTHPVWDVTRSLRQTTKSVRFLLTHPVWDVTAVGTPETLRNWFLLTHPVWDVTHSGDAQENTEENFYSHIPCGMWLFFPRTKC